MIVTRHKSIEYRLAIRSKAEGSCKVWTGFRDKDGYGRITIKNGRSVNTVHRIAWELKNGPVPHGLCVLHHCDNPPCFLIDHLFVGTNQDNADDSKMKNRRANGERNGSLTHPERRPRGEQFPQSKLTKEKVVEIRTLYPTGRYTHKQLGEMFGVSDTVIGQTINRIRWKHVA